MYIQIQNNQKVRTSWPVSSTKKTQSPEKSY